jgi:hypothetical protein
VISEPEVRKINLAILDNRQITAAGIQRFLNLEAHPRTIRRYISRIGWEKKRPRFELEFGFISESFLTFNIIN